MRLVLSLIFVLVITGFFFACKDAEVIEKVRFRFDKVDEMAVVTNIGYTIENGYNEQHADSIKNLISTVLLSNRMSDYKRIPEEERRLILGVIKGQLNEEIDLTIHTLATRNFAFKLINIKETNNGYKLVYQVLNREDATMVYNYVLFTLEKDKYGDFKIADTFDVRRGYTIGEVFNKTVTLNEIYKSRRNDPVDAKNLMLLEDVRHFAENEMFESAYATFKKIDKDFLDKWGLMSKGVEFTDMFSEELSIKEYEFLKNRTRHKESKMYYQCRYEYLKNKSQEAFNQCNNDFVEYLLADSMSL